MSKLHCNFCSFGEETGDGDVPEPKLHESYSFASDVPLYLTPAPCSVNDKESWETHCTSQYWYYYQWFMDWMNECAGGNLETNDHHQSTVYKNGREVCPEYNPNDGIVDIVLQNNLQLSDTAECTRSCTNNQGHSNKSNGKNSSSSNQGQENSQPASSSQPTMSQSSILSGGGEPPEEDESAKKLKSNHELDDNPGLLEYFLIHRVQCPNSN